MRVKAEMDGNVTTNEIHGLEETAARPFVAPRQHHQQPYRIKLTPRSLTDIILVAVIALVISVHLAYLLKVSPGVPHQDDWKLLDRMFRSADSGRGIAWVFDHSNGHFIVPAAVACLASLHFLSLDLTALRLLNFPICLMAFCLTVHLARKDVRLRPQRFYLYAGACFLIFNLSLWEHFAQANGFSAVLSALFGAIGLFYVARATQLPPRWKLDVLVGLSFLAASVLSLGAGYAALAAALLLGSFAGIKRLAVTHRIPRFQTVVCCLVSLAALLAVLSHPLFRLSSEVTQTVFRSTLTAGSLAASFLDKNSAVAQNLAFACGIMLIVASLWIAYHFLTTATSENRIVPVCALGLILFGLFGCLAVAFGRSYFPSTAFLSSRYTLYPSICLLGILLYFACWRTSWLITTSCLAATLCLLATIREYRVGHFRPAAYHRVAEAIRKVDNLSDAQLRAALYWGEDTRGVRRVAARMRRDKLGVFRPLP